MFSTYWRIKEPISWGSKRVFFGLISAYRAIHYRYVNGVYEEKWLPCSRQDIFDHAD